MVSPITTPAAGACRDGKKMIVPRGSSLPANCVKCGAVAQTPWRKKFFWHNPLLYLMIIFPGLLIYAIVALIVRKNMELNVPLCDNHHGERKRFLIVGTVLILGCVPAGIALGVALDEGGYGFLLGVVMFFASLVFFSRSAFLRPAKIDEFGGEFTGAKEEFLRLLPQKV
jgi:hypothetical protein